MLVLLFWSPLLPIKEMGSILLSKKGGLIFFIFILVFWVVALWSRFSFAVDMISVQSMEVSPPSQEIKVDLGKQTLVKAKIRNKSFSEIKIKVRIEDFMASGQDGQVALVEKPESSIKNWSLLSTESFSLKPNESKEITAMITLPGGLVGGQYGAFVFSVVGDSPVAGEAALAQEVASLFLLRIDGEVKEDLVLTDFKVPKFKEFSPIPMEIKFKNSGNVHIKPFGIINVRNVFGKTVKDIVVKGETNILPGATRIVRANLENKFLFGYYTAEALMNYGSKNESLSSTVNFVVLPVRLIGIALVVVFILYKGRKRLMKVWAALVGK